MHSMIAMRIIYAFDIRMRRSLPSPFDIISHAARAQSLRTLKIGGNDVSAALEINSR